MHTIEFYDDKSFMYMPENLAECDKWQYINMCELIFKYQVGQLSYFDTLVHGVYKLLNLKRSKKTLYPDEEDDKNSNIAVLSTYVETFFTTEGDRKVIKLEYTHNPVPEFKPLWKNYYGPSDGFTNITFGEYTDALRVFLDFSTTGEVKLLYILAAILYRKKKSLYWLEKYRGTTNGDIREPYNPHNIEDRADVFKYAPIGFIYGVYLLFASFQKYITGALVPWGGRELDLSILFDGRGGDDTLEAVPGLGLDSVTFALAESGEFGDKEKVLATSMWEVMLRLYDLKKKDLDYKLNTKM